MSHITKLCDFTEQALKNSTADQYRFSINKSETREFTYENGRFSLFRTLYGNSASVVAMVNKRMGSCAGTDISESALQAAVDTAIQSAMAAEPDPARDYAPYEEPMDFTQGCPTPDTEAFFVRLQELVDTVAREYPKVLVTSICGEHSGSHGEYHNSNGTVFRGTAGYYSVSLEFAGHDGEVTTNLDYCGASFTNLDTPLIELGSIREHLQNAQDQLHTTSIPEKFTGTVLFTPDCLGSFLGTIISVFMSDGVLIDGTSRWKDKLGQKVADERITLATKPSDPRIACPEVYMLCGKRVADMIMIENGVLKQFPLSLYAANKTGLPMAQNTDSCLFLTPGETPYADLVKQIKRGLIVGGFSGGEPGANGEFSGVAKNSYYVEDGKIIGAVNETMINGNLGDILNHVAGISKEVVEDGDCVLPYLAVEGIVISGK